MIHIKKNVTITRRLIASFIAFAFVGSPIAGRAQDNVPPQIVPKILATIRFASDEVFEKPVIMRALWLKNGSTVVTFSRAWSNVIVANGRKPTSNLLQATFTKGLVTIRYSKDFTLNSNPTESGPGLSEVTEFACSYLLKHSSVGNEFELNVSKHGDGYYVMVARIPYVPNSYAAVNVDCVKGKLSLNDPTRPLHQIMIFSQIGYQHQ